MGSAEPASIIWGRLIFVSQDNSPSTAFLAHPQHVWNPSQSPSSAKFTIASSTPSPKPDILITFPAWSSFYPTSQKLIHWRHWHCLPTVLPTRCTIFNWLPPPPHHNRHLYRYFLRWIFSITFFNQKNLLRSVSSDMGAPVTPFHAQYIPLGDYEWYYESRAPI